ncbi:uncharacterized protein LOC133189909 [Saccostrea echinata]|uniref:uncharacterized protein LOC133189909 n=1 Tax=Saccostrea echinata TaxID=191078 RepID=UPI002A814248|nr:uncharacterized protein LOC133189909 [Saccostrea echinata]
MPACQALNCKNEKGKCTKSFFTIPNPKKNAESKKRCRLWINNLKNGKLCFKTFVYSSSKVVCEDHFTLESFVRNPVAESLNFFPRCKRLKPDAVPTIVNTCATKAGKGKSFQKLVVKTKNFKSAQSKRGKARMHDLGINKRNVTKHTKSETDASEHPKFSESMQHNQPTIKDEPKVHVNNSSPSPAVSQVQEPAPTGYVYTYRPCGHPCYICLQSNLRGSELTSEHNYSAKKFCRTTRTIGTMTEVTQKDNGQNSSHI